MKALVPPDLFYVQAARSWLESGKPVAAQKELDRIPPESRDHPDVLEVQWSIEAQSRRWQTGLDIAEALIQATPERPTGWIKRSFVLDELNRAQDALDRLFPAAKRFPEIPIIPYNLACYASELQLWWEAERWLSASFQAGGADFRQMALRDKQLQHLWPRVSSL